MPDEIVERGAGVYSGESDRGDLRTRAASAVVLAVLALGANFAGAVPFAVLVSLLVLVVSWEWGRVVGGAGTGVLFAVHAASAAIAAALAASGMAALSLAALGIGAILVVPLRFGAGARLSALGVLYVGLPAVALIWLRGSTPEGALAILFVFLVVWTYDSAAFAAGTLIGGPKLWPSVSPKKTWAGLAGGIAASAAMGVFFSKFLLGSPPGWLAVCGVAFGVVAQGGDLLESALKRACGVKDTSRLIPGHGGFMDRLDSTMTVAVAAGLVALALDPRAPARVLLFGG